MIAYLLTFPNGKHYVGITSRGLARRLTLHRHHARKGRAGAVQNAIRKYGVFDAQVLAVAPSWAYLCDLEPRLIQAFGTQSPGGYNLTTGGEGAPGHRWTEKQRQTHTGRVVSEETRLRISIAGKGRKHTPEARAKISEAGRGREFSPERRARIGATKVGNTYGVGRPCKEETKRKISQGQKGRVFTEEHRAKLVQAKRKTP